MSAKGMLTFDQSFFPAFSELIILFLPMFLIVCGIMFVKLSFHSRNEIDFDQGVLYSFLGIVNLFYKYFIEEFYVYSH